MNWGARTVLAVSMARLIPRLSGDATPVADVVAPADESVETVEEVRFPGPKPPAHGKPSTPPD